MLALRGLTLGAVAVGTAVLVGARQARPGTPPHAVAEFAGIADALRQRQGLDVGRAVAPDQPDGEGSLIRFQRFGLRASVDAATFEEHPDGTIYLAYVAPRWPAWYAVSQAEDREGSRERPVATATGGRPFAALLATNEDSSEWRPAARAFPVGSAPQPRWLSFREPTVDSCAGDRLRLAALERQMAQLPQSRLGRLLRHVQEPFRRVAIRRLRRKLSTPTCRPRRIADWATLFSRSDPRLLDRVVPRATGPLAHAGDYCFGDVVSPFDLLKTGPPAWQTILPDGAFVNRHDDDSGAKRFDPGRSAAAPGNHYVSWQEVVDLTQTQPDRARRILAWTGHPTREDIKDHPIPWLSSTVEGVVTNSFLSGSDYAGSHLSAPAGYWLGDDGSETWADCGVLVARHSLCNDWMVSVRPDPPNRFMLATDREPEAGAEPRPGNFSDELRGSLEGEVEQWLIPRGFRPEPGDRIQMVGRWVVDCGHEDWHTELHPIEAFVSAHVVRGATLATLVVTGDWSGGTLELSLWPPARPAAERRLAWERLALPVSRGVTIAEVPEPPDAPNHVVVRIVSTTPSEPLPTGDWNEVTPHPTRRLAARYRVWWRP
jgi:hypothetical protein